MPAVVRHHWRASTPTLASISSRTTQRDRANGTRLHEEVSSVRVARGSPRRRVAREIVRLAVETANISMWNIYDKATIRRVPSFVSCIRKSKSDQG